jgi:hypothetical protein
MEVQLNFGLKCQKEKSMDNIIKYLEESEISDLLDKKLISEDVIICLIEEAIRAHLVLTSKRIVR